MVIPESYMFRFGENRFHRQVWQLISFLAVLGEAAHHAPPGTTGKQVLKTNHLPFDIHIMMTDVYAMYETGKIAKEIHFGPHQKVDPGISANYFDLCQSELIHNVFASFFCVAVDPYLDWLLENIGSGREKWPDTANFVRVVRNAISHCGTVNLNSPNAVGGKWRGISIDYNDAGKLIGEYVAPGDFIIMLHDFDGLLASFGAPMFASWQTLEADPEGGENLLISSPPPDRAIRRETPHKPDQSSTQ